MKTTKIRLAFALSTSLATLGCVAEEKVLNIYNWSDYMDPAAIEQFEHETGIQVNYDVYESNEVLEAKLMSGGTGYDIVIPTGSFLERQVKAGIYSKIDKSQLTNLKNLDPELVKKAARHDPNNRHHVPYTWGTIGLGYNKEAVEQRLGTTALNTFDLIFKPDVAEKLADCGIGIMDSPAEVMAIALNYLGLDPNSEQKSDLKQAAALLKSVRSRYKYFSSSKYITDLANGDICVALGYNGDMLQAQSRAQETAQPYSIHYTIPKEGTLVWFDLLAIPADAPHPQAAHQFINYILRPETGASIANFVYYAVANVAARPLLNDDVVNNPGIYTEEAVKARLFTQNAHSAKYDRQLTRAWSNIKTGR